METFYTDNKNKEVSSKQEQLENWWVFDTIAAWSSGDVRLPLGRGRKEALNAMLILDCIMNVRVTH